MKNNFTKYAPAVARIGVGLVFFIFGIWQLIRPENWFGYIPGFVLNTGILPGFIIFFNGIFDFVIGIALLSGFFVRASAAFGVLHLLLTSITLGWNDVAVRDFGLLIVLVSVFLHGPDEFCFGNRK
ncbi:MAG: hypothetical protein BV456_12985 [Thermoplasmata archaeon M8B2D]|nr:MAG: hypothetical protein BV456_12985 [Thermoplasmata archaeon M8B2D]